MVSRRPRLLVAYAIAILLVPVAVVLTILYHQFFSHHIFATFYLSVCISTWYGGRYPGLATVALSTLAINYFFLPPFGDWIPSAKDTFRLGIYLSVMLLIHWLMTELITARRRIEILSQTQIQQSHVRLQQALQAANMGIWDYDLQTGAIDWSAEHEQLFGLAPGSFDGRYETFESYVYPGDRQIVQQLVQQAITQTGDLVCQFRVVWADGSLHWVEGRGQVTCNASGQPIRLSGTVMNIDDRIQAEQALQRLNQELEHHVQQRTETLEAVFDRAAVGMTLTSPDGRFLKVNQAYCDLLGYTPEELLETNFDQITHPEDVEKGWQERRKLFSGAIDSFSLEKRYFHKDSSLVWVNIVVSAVHQVSGEVDYAICVVEDITQRKFAEAQLRSSEARYRAVVEDQTDLIVRFLPDSTILFINDAYCRYFGVQREDLIGKSYAPIIFEADREAVNQLVQSISDENSIVTIENRVVINGEIRWTQWINRMVCNQDGQFVELQAVGRDITDLKQVEESLRVSENRLKLALEGSGDGLWEWNIATGEIYLDSNWLGMLGYAEGELPLHVSTWSQLVHSDDYPWVTERLNAHFQDINHPFVFDYRMLTKAGDWKWIANYGRVVARSDDGTPLRMVGTHQDISDRKQAEEQLRISAERISLANAELSRAARLKDEFLAGMSHELRTPLNAILGMSEVLLEEIYGSLNSGQRESVNLIERSGQHLLTLINDILDLAKVESGKMDLEITSVKVQALCDTSLSFVKQQAYQKHIHLACNVATDLTNIELDERRIRQVLINLLSNAVKFTREGGRVELSARANPEQEAIEFAISDTGIGIAADQMERLFQPFVQLDSSLSRRYSGTGLGLALVRRIVELHSGSVTVTSEIGQGSCFTVILPWRRTQQLSQRETSPVTSAPTLPIQRALIVEDSEAAANQVSRYLSELGMTAVTHPLGTGVIDLALRSKPDVIILDILLPDLPGWEVLMELKAHPVIRNIPVLIISVVDERAKGLALGAADYLLKPIARIQLQQALHCLARGIDCEQKTALVVANQMAGPLVVLAEDNEANIEVVVNYLQAYGFRTAIARNGLEAVQLVKQSPPDLVLMDIQMPEMDGLEAIRRIRADTSLASLPIIALTALAMPGDRERCLTVGASEYLPKPISLKQLLQIIQQFLPSHSLSK